MPTAQSSSNPGRRTPASIQPNLVVEPTLCQDRLGTDLKKRVGGFRLQVDGGLPWGDDAGGGGAHVPAPGDNPYAIRIILQFAKPSSRFIQALQFAPGFGSNM